MPCHASPCHAPPCPASPRLATPCPAMPRPAMPRPAAPSQAPPCRTNYSTSTATRRARSPGQQKMNSEWSCATPRGAPGKAAPSPDPGISAPLAMPRHGILSAKNIQQAATQRHPIFTRDLHAPRIRPTRHAWQPPNPRFVVRVVARLRLPRPSHQGALAQRLLAPNHCPSTGTYMLPAAFGSRVASSMSLVSQPFSGSPTFTAASRAFLCSSSSIAKFSCFMVGSMLPLRRTCQ